MNILIMGGPGAGKGTMSAKIVEKYQVNHISTGNIFRSEIKNETELGLQAKSYTEKGLLVPDEVTNPMVKSFLEKLDNKNGYLLDGYPRTLDQAKAFDELTVGSDLAVEKVIALELDFEVLKDRITGRRICKNCEEIYHIKNHPSKVEGFAINAAVNYTSARMTQWKAYRCALVNTANQRSLYLPIMKKKVCLPASMRISRSKRFGSMS